MKCADVRKLLHGYIDDELDIVTSTDIEQHLHECAACSRILEQQRLYIHLMRNADLVNELPQGFASRVVKFIRHQRLSASAGVPAVWRYVAIAAVILLVVIIGARVISRNTSGAEDLLTDQIYQSHLRSLLVNHITDVVSSDQHTVKPWFNGKVGFSPTVCDLRDSGFALIGGRLDFIQSQPVAAIVYGRRLHIINLFIWPQQKENAGIPPSENRDGYTLLSWADNGMNYCAVSDLNPDELRYFVRLLKG